jgi:phosphate transport system substrate-binding protein
MKMKKIILMTEVCLIGLLLIAQPITAKELILAGSTTIQKRVLEPSSTAIEKATGIKIKILGIGTGGGFAKLQAGEVQASIASSPLGSILKKASLPDDGAYQEHVIISDVIVPIVHPDNPVSNLTWEQLADINTGKITNWNEVGGSDMKITVVTSHSGSATRAVFQKNVMKKAEYIASAMKVKSTREEVDLVAKLKGGVGAVSEGFVKLNPGKVKIVEAAKISRPLSFITKGDPPDDVKAIIDFLMTAEAQKLFQ